MLLPPFPVYLSQPFIDCGARGSTEGVVVGRRDRGSWDHPCQPLVAPWTVQWSGGLRGVGWYRGRGDGVWDRLWVTGGPGDSPTDGLVVGRERVPTGSTGGCPRCRRYHVSCSIHTTYSGGPFPDFILTQPDSSEVLSLYFSGANYLHIPLITPLYILNCTLTTLTFP